MGLVPSTLACVAPGFVEVLSEELFGAVVELACPLEQALWVNSKMHITIKEKQRLYKLQTSTKQTQPRVLAFRRR
jgi:hypothetical protein